MLAEKQRRAAQGEVQYITESQLHELVEQDPGSDIRGYEDLQTGTVTSWLLLAAGTPPSFMALLVSPSPAIGFLIETGALLHFPDTSHGLCTLYFLCPVWLSECLERIMHLKSSQAVARNGVIQAEDLRVGLMLKNLALGSSSELVLRCLLVLLLCWCCWMRTALKMVVTDLVPAQLMGQPRTLLMSRLISDAARRNGLHSAERGAVLPVSSQV